MKISWCSEPLHTNTMFKLTHTDKDRPLRWLWFAILSLLNWSRNSLEEHRQLSSCVRTSIDENKAEAHTLIMRFSPELKWSLELWLCSRQPCSSPIQPTKGKGHVTVWANLYKLSPWHVWLSLVSQIRCHNMNTTWTIDDFWPSDCCVTGRQMLKLHIWDWQTIHLNKIWPNLFTMCYLLQRENLLSGYVQIVAFYLTSPGPGEEVPQQGGL